VTGPHGGIRALIGWADSTTARARERKEFEVFAGRQQHGAEQTFPYGDCCDRIDARASLADTRDVMPKLAILSTFHRDATVVVSVTTPTQPCFRCAAQTSSVALCNSRSYPLPCLVVFFGFRWAVRHLQRKRVAFGFLMAQRESTASARRVGKAFSPVTKQFPRPAM